MLYWISLTHICGQEKGPSLLFGGMQLGGGNLWTERSFSITMPRPKCANVPVGKEHNFLPVLSYKIPIGPSTIDDSLWSKLQLYEMHGELPSRLNGKPIVSFDGLDPNPLSRHSTKR